MSNTQRVKLLAVWPYYCLPLQ